MAGVAISLENVCKRFPNRSRSATTLKSTVLDFIRRRGRPRAVDRFDALHDVNLAVPAGQSVGLIGRNGSGKSTALKLIAGIYRPDAGTVTVSGRVAALIELGAGFHPEFSGRENIFMNGMILGLTRRQLAAKMDEIVDFAGLGDFIDAPTRTYSSGMYMRLGFAVAVHVDPDILLIDEVLAVGDEGFAKRCYDRLAELRRRGTTLVVVTHEAVVVERWCDAVVWLDRGVVQAHGQPRKVIEQYQQFLARDESRLLAASHARPGADARRWGSGEVEIVTTRLRDADGGERYVYASGEGMRVTLGYRVVRSVPEAMFAFSVVRADGLQVYGTGIGPGAASLPAPRAGEAGEIGVVIDALDLIEGSYFLEVTVLGHDGSTLDHHSRRYPFHVRSTVGELGVARLRHHWQLGGVRPDRGDG